MTFISRLTKHQNFWRRCFIILATVVLVLYWGRAVHKPADGDFWVHQEFSRRLLTGTFLYADSMHVPYPPFWALFHVPTVFLPLPLAKGVFFPLGITALVGLFVLLQRLVQPHLPPREGQLFWIVTLAAFLASRYLLRDLAELGVNTLIVTLSWLAIYLWIKEKDWLAGTSLGLATALKCTPALFIFYFGWKRQWKMALLSLLFAGLLTVAPVFLQGPATYGLHMHTWLNKVWTGLTSKDPSVGTLGPEPLQNMALRPTLGRYLMNLPANHPGRAQHSAYMDFLDLEAHRAGRIANVSLGAIVLVVLWWWRKPVLRRDDPELLWQLAGVSLLILLYSPLTWGQHCVGVLPACYLISALAIVRGGMPRWMWGVIGSWILFTLVLNREIVGKSMHWLLQSYHVETFCIVGLLAVVFGCSRRLGN